jgi:sugar phosphate permease
MDSSQESNDKDNFGSVLAVIIWGIGDVYFIVSVVIAILFGMLSPDLQQHLHLSSSLLGVLSSVFFLCYGLAQLIGGRLMDSLGPRLTLSISALITCVGLFIFAKSESFTLMLVAQILSGIGLSTSYIGVIFLASTWFTPKRFSLISGITQMSADLAAVIVVVGMAYSGVLLWGYHFIMQCLAFLMFCITLLLVLVVRNNPKAKQVTHSKIKANLLADLKLLLSISQFWLGTLYFSTSFGVLLALSNLWNTPDQISYGHSLQIASIMTTMLPLGGAFGSVLSGWLSIKLKRTAGIAKIYSIGMFLISAILIYGPVLPSLLACAMLILLGFFFGGAVLGFPLVSQHIPILLRGTGFGIMATIAYLLSAFLQYLIGELLSNLTLHNSAIGIYDFKIALSPLVVTLAVGFIGSLWLSDNKSAEISSAA